MKKKYSTRALVFSGLAGVIIALAAVLLYFNLALGGGEGMSAAVKFASIYNILDTRFVGEADMQAAEDAAYRAMVEAIDDRWSYYMTPEEYESYKEHQSNSYTGIGVTIEPDEDSGYLRIRGVTEDSPADRAGIKIGDLMAEIDSQSLSGLTTTEVRRMISDKGSEEFSLTLHRTLSDGELEEMTVQISTERVFSNPVEYYMLDESIGYIRIKNFESECADRAIAAVDELMAQGAQGLVFDVRNNPGGLLSELTKLLDYLLPEGDMFVSVSEKGEESVRTSDAQCIELPMSVLINADSYSAAEFFAAALWEYDMAQTVGAATTGKSRSQINLVLSDGSAVHLSTNGYLTPNRVDLAQAGGLVPDHAVALSEEEQLYLQAGDLEFEDDAQLQTAHSVLLPGKKSQ